MPEQSGMTRQTIRAKQAASKSVMAFLQARMGSTRLPGKVLMPLQGKTILEHAIRRLRTAASVHAVAVLTTRLPEDDAIAQHASELGALVYRGPELDVLARFFEAAEEFGPEIIIRATADNPLIEIGSIDRIVNTLCIDRADLCMEVQLPYGAATEAVTADALAEAHLRAREPHHREHVTLYIKDHPEEFRISYPVAPRSVCYPDIRVTVDTPEDFAFVDHLIRQLPESSSPLPLTDYLPFALNRMRAGELKAFSGF
ncbi:MAG: glycosyltransferase family protein [Acidobacteriota bacterium]|nr:glycosyltransferase family protein [Acidobacteriota bacterium]